MNGIGALLRQTREQRRVPPHAVEYARRRIGRVGSGVRRRARRLARYRQHVAARRAVADAAGPESAAVVDVDGAWQVAVDYRFEAVRQVADDNLAAVSRLLDGGRVPFFVRDASGPGPITVGVADEHRSRALAALARAGPADLLYARDDRGGQPVILRGAARAMRKLSDAGRVFVYRNHRLSDGYSIGMSHACVIEFWRRAGGNLRPPAGADPGRVVSAEVTPAAMTVGGRRYPTLSAFADHQAMTAEVDFPVDVVYTWVDDSDPQWRSRLAEERARLDGGPVHPESANASRYRNRDELRYSLRSLALYADFVRRIFVVTAGHVPDWLDVGHPRIQVVDHTEILPAAGLPTFNSHAIEARLHHIDGLAEHYLYLNDDFLFGRQVTATTFFTPNGLAKIFVDEEAPIPAGPPSAADRPVDSAAKNVRDLLRVHLGIRAGRKMLHVPYPQLRSVLTEMEERFPDDFARTAGSRFRQPTDVSIASCFAHYYAYATRRAVPAQIQAEYLNIGSRWAPLQMHRLLRHRDRDAVCLNETDLPADRLDVIDEQVGEFLRSYVPVPSPFEVSQGPPSATEPEERDHIGEAVDGR